MKLKEIQAFFKNGDVDKQRYIDLMYQQHSLLFDYRNFISDTNISSIEILDSKVIMTFRDSGIKFSCIENDKRLAPLDTLNFGSYENEEMQMQFHLINDGMNVFDIGANLGWYSLHVAKMKPNCKIYAFEPLPATFAYLSENIKLNRLTNITIFNFGFSDSDGTFTFFYDPQLSVNASLTNLSESQTTQEVNCIVQTLDRFIEKTMINIDFLKCDVEGAELLVFKGGRETIKQNLPIIFSEMLRKWSAKFNYHPNDIIKSLKDLGYQCFVIEDRMLKQFELVDESTPNTNFIFLHTQKHAEKILEHSRR